MPKHFVTIAGLKEGEYRQTFDIKDKFFEAYEKSEVKEGEFLVSSLLIIRGLDRKLTLSIDGVIKNLLCDYCAEKLNHSIYTTLNFIIKDSEKEIESADEIIYVLPNQYQLSINQLIFEMIILAIPSKRFHEENGKINCDKRMLLLIDKYATKQKQEADPRWETLKKLK